MKTIGTLMEWHKKDPDQWVANDHMQKGVAIRLSEYVPEGRMTKYESGRADGQPWIYFGSKCPYIVDDLVYWFVAWAYGVGGGLTAMSNELANDPNWYNVELDEQLAKCEPGR
jgi:hypothetical protein